MRGQGRKAQDSRKIIRKTSSTELRKNLDLSLVSSVFLSCPLSHVCSSQDGKVAWLHGNKITWQCIQQHLLSEIILPLQWLLLLHIITLNTHYYYTTQRWVLHCTTSYLKEIINILFLCIRLKNHELLISMQAKGKSKSNGMLQNTRIYKFTIPSSLVKKFSWKPGHLFWTERQ